MSNFLKHTAATVAARPGPRGGRQGQKGKGVLRIAASLKPLYGAFPGLTLAKDAKAAARYIKAIGA
jgi:hypothetical protein